MIAKRTPYLGSQLTCCHIQLVSPKDPLLFRFGVDYAVCEICIVGFFHLRALNIQTQDVAFFKFKKFYGQQRILTRQFHKYLVKFYCSNIFILFLFINILREVNEMKVKYILREITGECQDEIPGNTPANPSAFSMSSSTGRASCSSFSRLNNEEEGYIFVPIPSLRPVSLAIANWSPALTCSLLFLFFWSSKLFNSFQYEKQMDFADVVDHFYQLIFMF